MPITTAQVEDFYSGHEKGGDKIWWKNHVAPILRLLNECLEVKDDLVSCLKPVDEVVELVKAKYENPNTIKYYLQALLFLVDTYPGLKDKVPRDKYHTAWLDSKVVKIDFDEKKEPTKNTDINTIQETIDKFYGEDSVESVFVKFYREVPLRLDFNDIFVYGTLKKVPEDVDKFLVLQNKKVYLKKYTKTAEKYGEKEIKLSDELVASIKKSLAKKPREKLFVFTNSNLSKAISGMLRKAGIDGTMNTLRHSVMSQEDIDRPEMARRAGHSVETNMAYRRPQAEE